MNRISRDRMFMEIAKVVAQRGTCDRARVGAVLVDSKNKVVSIGYNGAPHGEKHCDEVGHLMFDGHCIRTIHAEENCLEGIVLEGKYTLYVTHYPCEKCQIAIFEKLMRSNGAQILVVYGERYGSPTFFETIDKVHKVLQFTHYEEEALE